MDKSTWLDSNTDLVENAGFLDKSMKAISLMESTMDSEDKSTTSSSIPVSSEMAKELAEAKESGSLER